MQRKHLAALIACKHGTDLTENSGLLLGRNRDKHGVLTADEHFLQQDLLRLLHGFLRSEVQRVSQQTDDDPCNRKIPGDRAEIENACSQEEVRKDCQQRQPREPGHLEAALHLRLLPAQVKNRYINQQEQQQEHDACGRGDIRDRQRPGHQQHQDSGRHHRH